MGAAREKNVATAATVVRISAPIVDTTKILVGGLANDEQIQMVP